MTSANCARCCYPQLESDVCGCQQVDMSDCHELDDAIFHSLCDGRRGLQGYNAVAFEGGSPNLRQAAPMCAVTSQASCHRVCCDIAFGCAMLVAAGSCLLMHAQCSSCLDRTDFPSPPADLCLKSQRQRTAKVCKHYLTQCVRPCTCLDADL